MAYLDKLANASSNSNTMETFKNVIAFVAGGLYSGLNYMKPLNSYLGETVQGSFSEGSLFFAEKICHNPSISAF